MMRVAPLIIEEVALSEFVANGAGYYVGRIEHLNPVVIIGFNITTDQWVVGAGQKERFDLRKFRMGEVVVEDDVADVVVHKSLFDHWGEQGSSQGADFQLGLQVGELLLVNAGKDGRLGGDDTYLAETAASDRFDERVDDVDKKDLPTKEFQQHLVAG